MKAYARNQCSTAEMADGGWCWPVLRTSDIPPTEKLHPSWYFKQQRSRLLQQQQTLVEKEALLEEKRRRVEQREEMHMAIQAVMYLLVVSLFPIYFPLIPAIVLPSDGSNVKKGA